MSVFLKPQFLNVKEICELQSNLSHIHEKNNERPKTRYIYPLSPTDIPCFQRIIPEITKLIRIFSQNDMYHYENSYGSITLIIASPDNCQHQHWHRDTNFKAFVACIPLVNVDVSNGCTEILLKTAKSAPNRWKKAEKNKIQMQCCAGDLYVFDARLLHRGLANMSDRDRPILFIQFVRNKSFILDQNLAKVHSY